MNTITTLSTIHKMFRLKIQNRLIGKIKINFKEIQVKIIFQIIHF